MAADGQQLPALLQLASSGLPIGGFSYSSGLESAVETGVIGDADSAGRWIRANLLRLWARNEARVWPALYRAWEVLDHAALQRWNGWLLAGRDTAELRLETTQMGRSLALWLLKLSPLARLDPARRELLEQLTPLSHATTHALAAFSLGLDLQSGLHALGWSLLEAQVSAAVRLVPLGQTDGQQVLRELSLDLAEAIGIALAEPASAASNFAPMLSILSARHENQYSRLFRS